MPSVIVLFLEVDAFAGTILAFAYIVIDRLVIDLGFGIVIEGIVTADGGVIFGCVLVAVIDVGLLISDFDVTLATAFGACFLVFYDDGLILFLFFCGSLFFLLNTVSHLILQKPPSSRISYNQIYYRAFRSKKQEKAPSCT